MNKREGSETSYKVQVIDRVLDILDSFTFENREMNLTEVVEKTGLNKATAKRLLSNLTRRKYLQQDSKTKKYKLGLRLFELGGIVFSSFSVRKTAEHWMERLREETGSTVLLGVIIEDQLVYLGKREGNQMIRISSEIGWRRPLNYGMLGMVLLAYQDIRYVERILDKYPLRAYTPNSITEKEKFLRRLGAIRKQGYVIEVGEAVEGVVGIAAPVRNFSNNVVAALGIALPFRKGFTEKELDTYVKLLKSACDDISLRVGFKK